MLVVVMSTLLIALSLIAYYKRFAYFRVPTQNMEPTIVKGSRVIVETFNTEDLSRLKYGDIVAVASPDDATTLYLERVLGLPGDSIEIRDKRVIRNGALVTEPYVRYSDGVTPNLDSIDRILPWRNNTYEIVVPPMHLFVMSDNRDRSVDSRLWGPVQSKNLYGRVVEVMDSEPVQGTNVKSGVNHKYPYENEG